VGKIRYERWAFRRGGVRYSLKTLWTSGKLLLRDTIIEGELVNEGPLRIGAGREPPLESIADLAVIRIKHDGVAKPYIPGSSIKGVFRSSAGSLLSLKNPKVTPCDGLSKSNCPEAKFITISGEQIRLASYIERCLRDGVTEEAMEVFFKEACLLCKVFGAPHYAGRVSFSDSYPISTYTLGTRTGIAIDRKTGAVYKHALYTVEYVEPGAIFSFKIHARNLPNYVLGLLAAIIRRMNEGEVKIGGFKSRGFGKVKIEKLRLMNKDGGSKELILPSLEEGVDMEVRAEGLAKLKDGWLVSEGGECQLLLKRLEEVWEAAKL